MLCKSALLRNPLVQRSAELAFDSLSGIVAQIDTGKNRSKETGKPASERGDSCDDGGILAQPTEGYRYSNRLKAKQSGENNVCDEHISRPSELHIMLELAGYTHRCSIGTKSLCSSHCGAPFSLRGM